MASTAEEGDLGHLNVDLVFVGVMKILVPCFFLGNFCGDKMVFPRKGERHQSSNKKKVNRMPGKK
jgi:hypothetical protein